MKIRALAGSLALAMAVAAPASAFAGLDLTGVGYYTYGNTNSYSLPLTALAYSQLTGGAVGPGPGNPFYINSTPGAIKDTIVIYTGSNGTDVTTNVAGFDDAYGVPNGKTNPYASMGQTIGVATPTPKAGITNNLSNTWDASVDALKSFLGTGTAIFLFNNNDTNADQTLAIWARLWITDGTGALAAGTRSLYLSNHGQAYSSGTLGGSAGGVENGDATAFLGGEATDPLTGTTAATDFVRSGGNVTDPLFGPVKHNLGANQVAYAGVLPLLNQYLNTLSGAEYTVHLDLRMGCQQVGTGKNAAPFSWDTCDNVSIDNGYEQLFLVSSESTLINVPEPGSLALVGLALAGLALSRRRQS